jgi:hypothetical protein
MEMIINLIIQLVAGVVGGNAAGAALKDYNLGGIGNTIAGALGGVGGGQLLQVAIPAIAAAAGGNLDVGAIIGQIVGGGAGGAILTVIVGLVKSMMASQQTR